jgi:hypothetical protein
MHSGIRKLIIGIALVHFLIMIADLDVHIQYYLLSIIRVHKSVYQIFVSLMYKPCYLLVSMRENRGRLISLLNNFIPFSRDEIMKFQLP